MTSVDRLIPQPPTGRARMRLVLCFDGTWNDPEDQTNVSRIHAAIPDIHGGCPDQLKFYDTGVGTELGNAIRGGAAGRGLDVNILQGFCWLIEQYEPGPQSLTEDDGQQFRQGDEIFVFGFSRGAFTARSLVGLLNRCGIPRREIFKSVSNGDRPIDVNHPLVRKAWDLYCHDFKSTEPARDQASVAAFRRENCWDVKVKFIGVWDTVGALGIPFFAKPFQRKYRFHDTQLCRIVENAFHAVAIDEHREDFDVALWTGDKPPFINKVEQRWFPGAHANVGGGYEDDLLPDPSLYWIAERALECGLKFSKELTPNQSNQPDKSSNCQAVIPKDFKLQGNEHLGDIRDSFREMFFGVYRLLKRRKPHYRQMLLAGVNETIDQTAYLKWAKDAKYRPLNLAFAGRSDVYR